MQEASLGDFLRFARAYSGLGSAVQHQLERLILGETEDLNPNAIALIVDRLAGISEELDEILENEGCL